MGDLLESEGFEVIPASNGREALEALQAAAGVSRHLFRPLPSGLEPIDRESSQMGDTLDLTADLLYDRWRRAVDRLWRETVLRRRASPAERERVRAARRLKNLQRIVRRALSEYHRIELERQRRTQERVRRG